MLAKTPMLRSVALISLLFTWPGGANAQAATSLVLEKQLDQLVTTTLHEQQIPALTVAIARGDRVIYSKAFGMADLENSIPTTHRR
jgi:CubicO group peptidase (beta-lactamase class C family)